MMMTTMINITMKSFLLRRPGSGAEYCDQPVCLSVCLSASISLKRYTDIYQKFCVPIACGSGSVLYWRRYDTLCTSSLWMTPRLAVMGRIVKRER